MRIDPIFSAPSTSELSARIEKLQSRLAELDLTHYVSFSPDNIYYLTNFANYVHERPFVLVVPRTGTPRFIVPKLEIPHVEARSVGAMELISYDEFPAPEGRRWSDRFRSLFDAGSRAGFESVCPWQIHTEIPVNATCVDIVDELRLVKSDYEIGRLAYACQLVTDAHNTHLATARPGRTMSEMASATRSMIMERLIADNPEINIMATKVTALCQSSDVAHDPHNFTNLNMRMHRGGPHVSVVNAVLNGYGGEVERTFFLGEVPEKAKKPFETMLHARHIVLEMAVPGESMSLIDRRVKEHLSSKGFHANLLHRAGHGMGVTAHEAPFFAEGYEKPLQAGMCLTVEPGVYIEGIGGFRHSDTVLIGESGPVLLTNGPTSLEELTLHV